MNLSFFIARKYFFSRKKKNFINIISILSMFGVAFGTAALVIVLSVFNGLEGLIRTLFETFDPEIKILDAKSRPFVVKPQLMARLKNIEGVGIVTEVVEENALLELRDDKRVVKVKGISDNFLEQSRMDSAIVFGDFKLHKGGRPYALVGRGIQYSMNISLNNEFYPMKLSFPNNKKVLNPTAHDLLVSQYIPAGGVFAIEKQYDDNYIFTPIAFARSLFGLEGKVSSLEVKTKDGANVQNVKKALQKALGKAFEVQDSDEQHASFLRAIKIEKLFVYIVFTFLLLIAAINIFFSLTMLTIEKKKDVAILLSMGAGRRFVRNIFLAEGLLIAVVGAASGLAIGFIVCYGQEHFGIVSMGMETSIVDAYPVKMESFDFIYTGLSILLLTIIISIRPAYQASQVSIKDNL